MPDSDPKLPPTARSKSLPKTARRSSALTALLASWRPIAWLLIGWLLSTSLTLLWYPRCYRTETDTDWRHVSDMDLRPRFVLFGDSLSQKSFEAGGWGAALQDKYARKVDVVNRGYSGYNTRWASYLLPKIFPLESNTQAPVLVTILVGTNDAVLASGDKSDYHVPHDEYKQNLLRMVEHLRLVSKTTRIILIAPPPVEIQGRKRYAREAYGAGDEWEPERTNDHTGLYAAACREAGQEAGVPVVDLWTLFQQDDNWAEYLNDGLHFTPEGSAVVFKHVLAAIEALPGEPSLKNELLPWDYPIHSDIDPQNPKRTFEEWETAKRAAHSS